MKNKSAGGSSCLILPLLLALAQPVVSQTLTITSQGNRLTAGISQSVNLTRDSRFSVVWKLEGESAWKTTVFENLHLSHSNTVGLGFSMSKDSLQAYVRLKREKSNCWVFSGRLENRHHGNIRLARFNYLQGHLIETGLGLLNTAGKLIHRGTSLVQPNLAAYKNWQSMNVEMPQLQDAVNTSPDLTSSTDTGIFTKTYSSKAWFFGFTGPGTAFGEIGLFTRKDQDNFYATVLLDNVVLEPGKSRELENLMLSYGDWQQALDYWASTCARILHPEYRPKPLTGYCSWYQFGENITAPEFEKAVEEFKVMPVPPGGRTIQLDDGYQVMPGDWRPNPRFERVWDALPGKIAASGSIPGTYLVPTAMHSLHPELKAHPEWLQRLPDGNAAVSFSNWAWSRPFHESREDSLATARRPLSSKNLHPAGVPGENNGKTFFLEPDRPEVRDFMAAQFTAASRQGWKYIKIDFTYALSTARVAYDPHLTSFQTMQRMYRLFREASGKDMILNACIGDMSRYAIGSVDIARLGGDMGSNWSTVKENLRQLLMAFHTNGVWWQGDPDVFYMRSDKNGLNFEENKLVTESAGILGGVFLTSDYPSQWNTAARSLVGQYWTQDGPMVPVYQYVLYTPGGDPLALVALYGKNSKIAARIGFYNWSDQAVSRRHSFADLHLPARLRNSPGFCRAGGVRVKNSEFSITDQPAHSIRVFNFMNR